MSTPQTIGRVAPRFPARHKTLMTAFGVLVAIAVSIMILALIGANHTTAASPPAPSDAGTSAPQIRYLGPRQEHTTVRTTHTRAVGTSVLHYICVPEKYCIR